MKQIKLFLALALVFAPSTIHAAQFVLFDVTFTFTTAGGGTPQSFTNTDSRPHQTGNVTCQISGSKTDPQGDTFSISGTVTGWLS